MNIWRITIRKHNYPAILWLVYLQLQFIGLYVHNRTGSLPGPTGFLGKIAAGQGFFVKMNDGAPGSATVTFNNSMRSASHRNDQFFKTTNQNATQNGSTARLWIDLVVNNSPSVTRTLVAYIDGATNDNDRLFDATAGYQSAESFYSVVDNNIFTIQGRALPFATTDVVPLGFGLRSSNATGYKIAIATMDGQFLSQAPTVYLEDKLLNITHNLSTTPYNFTSVAGIHNNRFVLRYTNATLSTNVSEIDSKQVYVYKENAQIGVKSIDQNIASVSVYNMLGRSVFTKNNINASSFTIDKAILQQQTLIVKVTLEGGTIVSKKIVY